MRPVALRLAGGAALVGLLAAACGGGGDSEAGPSAAAVRTQPAAQGTGAGSCPASAGLGEVVKDHGVASVQGAAVTIESGDSFFAPTCVTVAAPGKVKVTVKNTGSALHNFSVTDQGIDLDVSSGKTVTVEVETGSPSLVFFCKYHRTSGMVGALLQQAG